MIDLYEEKVTVVRCRCSDCESYFRHCPGESTAADRPVGCADARRSRGRSACRCAPRATFGVSVSRMSVWRDVHEAGRNARRKQAGGVADETVVRVKGVKTDVGVVTDAETGQVLGLDALVERDSDRFMESLGDFARDYGARRWPPPT